MIKRIVYDYCKRFISIPIRIESILKIKDGLIVLIK